MAGERVSQRLARVVNDRAEAMLSAVPLNAAAFAVHLGLDPIALDFGPPVPGENLSEWLARALPVLDRLVLQQCTAIMSWYMLSAATRRLATWVMDAVQLREELGTPPLDPRKGATDGKDQ